VLDLIYIKFFIVKRTRTYGQTLRGGFRAGSGRKSEAQKRKARQMRSYQFKKKRAKTFAKLMVSRK
jgi:hypothetical protein